MIFEINSSKMDPGPKYKINDQYKQFEDADPPIDVLIVGAGLSGLTSAFKILKKEPSLRILVVEEEDSIGGEVRSSVRGKVETNWVSPDHYHILDLCKELNVATKKRHIMRADLKRCWEIDGNKLIWFEISRILSEIDLRSQLYRPGRCGTENELETMEQFICSRLFFEESRQFLRFIIKFQVGVWPQFVTVPQFLSHCYQTGGILDFLKRYTGEDPDLIEINSDELLRNLQDKINPIYIFTQSKIVEINHYKDYVEAWDNSGNIFRASVLILAIPWISTLRIKITPPIPKELQLPNNLKHTDRFLYTSYIAVYADGYWRRKGFSGSFLSHTYQLTGFEINPVCFSGLILHEDRILDFIKENVLERLAMCYGPEMLTPKAWVHKTYFRDIYVNIPETTPWNRIIWSSSWAATRARGYVNGAVQSGLRAALHTLLTLRPQNVCWEDIIEIQKASAVYPRVSSFQIFRASLNLYNSVYYFALTVAVLSILHTSRHLINKFLR